ncbi:MAG: hypothetical protein IJT25_00780 [Clostridia bacterium]|nr:hypothetical protein [Clostridia bacterium]
MEKKLNDVASFINRVSDWEVVFVNPQSSGYETVDAILSMIIDDNTKEINDYLDQNMPSVNLDLDGQVPQITSPFEDDGKLFKKKVVKLFKNQLRIIRDAKEYKILVEQELNRLKGNDVLSYSFDEEEMI